MTCPRLPKTRECLYTAANAGGEIRSAKGDRLLTPERLKDKLVEAVNKAGGQRKWAKVHGVSEQYVCDVIQGRRGIGQKLAHPLGYKPVTMYEPVPRYRVSKD